jgi:hypothetical protein
MLRVLLVFALSLLGTGWEARACSCQHVPVQQHVDWAHYVFAGTVVAVDTVGRFVAATIEVDEVWKGAVPRRFEVWTGHRYGSCDYDEFEVGSQLVLFAFDPVEGMGLDIGQIYTHLCAGNRKYAEAADELAVLGPGAAPVAVEPAGTLPEALVFDSVHPNPVRTQAVLSSELARPGAVDLGVYDVLGREVATAAFGHFATGAHSVAWNVGRVQDGVYLVRLRAGRATVTRRFIVVRP